VEEGLMKNQSVSSSGIDKFKVSRY